MQGLFDLIVRMTRHHPIQMRYRPARSMELAAFERAFEPIPPDFRWFLTHCGGGVVGCEWVDGISRLEATHEKFKREKSAGGWRSDMFAIGWDGAENPFGVDQASSAVVVEDHNAGDVRQLAPSFEDFLFRGLCQDVS